MSLIQVHNLFKSFSGESLFKDVSFTINEKDKIGLIGLNGAGKSTLIKIILGLEEWDIDPLTSKEGTISKKSNLKIGYLSQQSDLNEENTLFDELLNVFGNLKNDYNRIQEINNLLINQTQDSSLGDELLHLCSSYEEKGGYNVEYKIKKVLMGLDISEEIWNNKISTLSGGQKSRVCLCKILLKEPELLILDEPTNHLDINAIQWLEEFLQSYKHSFILISHDIYFLDNTIKKIFELENKTLKSYSGNYTAYTIQKEIMLSGIIKEYNKEQEKIQKLEEFVLKYKAGQKSKQARGRQKILHNMEKMENPIINNKKINLSFQVITPSTKKVLEVRNLSKSFNQKTLFRNFNLSIEKGDRVGLVGKNGIGKSTILKIINSLETYDEGEIEFGEKLNIGYFDQHHSNLYPQNTILEEIQNNFAINEEEARGLAGKMLFSQDDVFKKISSLSGGEKARVAFIKLILSKPNFLILDEPTNHLDIYSRAILESSFDHFEGSMLVVSHDRHFLDRVVNKISLISKEKNWIFNGNYTEYSTNHANINNKKEKISNKLSTENKSKKDIVDLKRYLINLERTIKKLYNQETQAKECLEKLGTTNDIEEIIKAQEQLDTISQKILNLLEELEIKEQELTKTMI